MRFPYKTDILPVFLVKSYWALVLSVFSDMFCIFHAFPASFGSVFSMT